MSTKLWVHIHLLTVGTSVALPWRRSPALRNKQKMFNLFFESDIPKNHMVLRSDRWHVLSLDKYQWRIFYPMYSIQVEYKSCSHPPSKIILWFYLHAINDILFNLVSMLPLAPNSHRALLSSSCIRSWKKKWMKQSRTVTPHVVCVRAKKAQYSYQLSPCEPIAKFRDTSLRNSDLVSKRCTSPSSSRNPPNPRLLSSRNRI
jgi:hypothetical protein